MLGTCCSCGGGTLRLPVGLIRDLMEGMRDDAIDGVGGGDEADQNNKCCKICIPASSPRPNQRRIQMLLSASAPPLPRRVAALVTQKADVDGDGWVTYQEFCQVILRHKDDLEVGHVNALHRLLSGAVKSVTPKFYDEYYTCCPPPLFIIMASLIEVIVYIFYSMEMKEFSLTAPTPLYSPLIFDPFRRFEVWRFLTYALLHNGFVHIANNLILQLVVGLPLEMVHGSWRLALVYVLGALTGCLAHSVTDFPTFLLGASGGVYALLGAHGANVILNWNEMRFGVVRAVLLGLYVAFDLGWALYQRYGQNLRNNVGYVAHLGGFIGGLLLGILCLKNFRVLKHERFIFWAALVALLVLFLIGVVVNVAYDGYFKTNDLPLGEYIRVMWKDYGPK